jgi:O-antigen ligase
MTWRIPTFDLRFWIFVGISSISLFTSTEISLSMFEIVRMLKMYILILLLRHYVKGRRELLNVVLFLLLGLGVQSSLGIAQGILKRTFAVGFLGEREQLWLAEVGGQSLSRVGGTLGHANAMASYLELMLPLTLALSFIQTRTRYRLALLTLFGLGTAAMILTLSRSGWGGLALGSLLTVWLVARRRGFRLRRLLPTLLPLGISVILIAILFWQPIMVRLLAPSPYSVSFRLNLARVALEMVKAQPLIGMGLNTFKEVMPEFDPQGLFASRSATVHNIYLLVAAETGLLGVGAFLWFLVGLFQVGISLARSKDDLYVALAAGICGGFLGLLAHGFLSWLFRLDSIFTLFWFLVGLLTAVARLEIKARPTSEGYATESVENNDDKTS